MDFDSDAAFEYRWVREHWWSNYHELRRGSELVASLRVTGSSGIAELGDQRYKLKRSRWPAFITLRTEDTDDLRARLSLLPLPPRAEFDDGESFWFGWVEFWKSEWAWTREDGETVLLFRQGRWLEPSPGPGACSHQKIILLATLQRAIGALSNPWF
jgi:hypothetical protein